MIAAASVIAIGAALAADFGVSEIEPDGDIGALRAIDCDGDGRRDLVVSLRSSARGREVVIYLQRGDARLPTTPDRRIEIKRDIAAAAFADARAAPGMELLLFTPASVFSFDTARSEYVGNAEKLFDQDLAAMVAGAERLPFLDGELSGSGELLVPGDGAVAIVAIVARAGEPPALRRVATLALPRKEGLMRLRRERRLELSAERGPVVERHEPFESVLGAGGGGILEAASWSSAPALADADGDGRGDILYIESDGDTERLRLHRRAPDGGLEAQPSWTGDLDDVDELRAIDLDGDRAADLLALRSLGRDGAVLRVHRNRGASFDLATPDQAIKLSGHNVAADALDLDGDGRRELVVTTHTVPGIEVLAGGSIERSLLIYAAQDDGSFARRPSGSFVESFDAREFRGLGQGIRATPAFGAPKRPAAIVVERDGAVGAHAISPSWRIESAASWRFTPRRVALELSVVEMSDDGLADLILRHARAVTVLVSRP